MLNSIDAANLKLIRAEEHIEAIRKHVASYSASDPHERTLQPNSKEKVSVSKSPPLEISILAGEAVHQIRSTLDHLAFDLVKLNPSNIQLPANWEENCLFPLWLNPPKKPAVYNCFSGKLPGISKQAFARIEGYQPYRGTPIGHVLGTLAELSNVDKHRHLNLIKARLDVREQISTLRGNYASIRRIEDGAELDPVADTWIDGCEPVQVERSVTSGVSFDEPGLKELTRYQIPIQDVLQLILEQVKKIIVPAFRELFDNP
jgi:hypothetical protein